MPQAGSSQEILKILNVFWNVIFEFKRQLNRQLTDRLGKQTKVMSATPAPASGPAG
jgi:hypothetical protein